MDGTWALERLSRFGDALAFRSEATEATFRDLVRMTEEARVRLRERQIAPGSTVVVHADFTADAIALLLALYLNGNIVVPLYDPRGERLSQVCELVAADHVLSTKDEASCPTAKAECAREIHPLVAKLRAGGDPGLILISSGSSGKPKAMLLNQRALFDKYEPLEARPATILTFLLFDHIGGFNTLFHTLFTGGTLIPAYSRAVDDVCATIQRWKVQVLPATPTFLNMLLVSRAYERFDLSSLSLITYGTEVMPESTLKKLSSVFPDIRLKQTYGMSEIGILSTRSEDSKSLWISIGKGVQHKVVDGILWLKSQTAMLGYLNAESPFDTDGWLCTGDLVEQKGDKYLILGRKESIINVGGLKVYPAEVESHLLQVEGVKDALAWGKKNPVTGQVVAVKVLVDAGVQNAEFTDRLKRHCRAHLEEYKVPRHFDFTTEPIHGSRFKKLNAGAQGG